MSKADPTAPERVQRDKEKKLKAGMCRVNVWVHSSQRERLLKYVSRLRKESD